MSIQNKTLKLVLIVVCASFLFIGNVAAFNGIDLSKYENVIMLIPDGCDETVQTAARWYKGDDLQVDQMVGGGVKVHMANSVIPGSAAAATAFATGHKTTVRFLGVGPREEDLLTGYEPTAEPYAPIASVLEAAKLAGKSTGLVATSRVTHATPAAYGCHIEDRGWDNDIMEHLVYNNIDVVFGGGKRHLLPAGTCANAEPGGRRSDCENLLEVLLDRDYQFVETRDDMLDLNSGKAWGLFNMSHMQPDIDRQHFAPTEPSIAEMTAKAIELLSQNKKGFFLMVEGSQVDWAGHNNDPIYMITDFLAFDDAVKVACDFADDDKKTLVMAFPDHNTGGMKIGHYYTSMSYTATTIEDLVGPLMGMTMSANGVVEKMDEEGLTMEDALYNYWGIVATSEDIEEINELKASLGTSYAMARVISKNHTVFGWTTHGHNGETVPFWLHGAKNVKTGLIDNTDLAFIAAEAMKVDLDKTTEELYVDLDTVTDEYVINDDDPENLVVVIGNSELPVSKDYMVKKGKMKMLPGLTVYAPATQKVYISEKAVKELKINKKGKGKGKGKGKK